MNRKQILMDFYLYLLSVPIDSQFRILHMHLYAHTRNALAFELQEEPEVVQRIFERMAEEDK